MTARTQRVFAWVVASGCLIGACLAAALAVLNDTAVAAGIGLPLAAASFVATGGVLVTRLSGNLVGWLLMAVGLAMLLLVGGEQYALYTLKTSPGTLPGGLVAAWLSGWTYAPMLTALTVWLPLVFPTGHLLSPRWRLIA